MKVLLFGGNGQLGRALRATAPESMSITAPSRTELDLHDPAAIARAVRSAAPSLVLNAAAYTAVDRAEAEPDLARAINAEAVGAMARAVRELGSRLIHVSTDFVFDGLSPVPYAPDAPRRPLSVYGRTKAEGEDLAGPDAAIVRTSWVHAAGGANFVRTMLRIMRERGEVRVVADQIGAPTWARSLAVTIWGLADKRASGIFHHRDAGVASWYDFAVAIAEEALVLGMLDAMPDVIPIPTRDYPTPAARPAFSLLDDAATRAILGDRTAHWRANLRTMLKEEQSIG